MKTILKIAAVMAFAATPIVSQNTLASNGSMTLAEILLSDGDQFDSNQNDFDIVTQAVLATGLGEAAGKLELTAFLPTDKAFRILVEDLYGVSISNEEALFSAIVANLGVETVGTVLLYHLVGGSIDSAAVMAAGNGAKVQTLLGSELTLDFKGQGQIRLIDGATSLRDPIIRQVDIFASNGVAHVIDRVLVP